MEILTRSYINYLLGPCTAVFTTQNHLQNAVVIIEHEVTTDS